MKEETPVPAADAGRGLSEGLCSALVAHKERTENMKSPEFRELENAVADAPRSVREEVMRLRNEVRQLSKDAERYRWLRSRPNGSEDWWAALDEGFGENMDRAIDVRMQASEAVAA